MNILSIDPEHIIFEEDNKKIKINAYGQLILKYYDKNWLIYSSPEVFDQSYKEEINEIEGEPK